MEQILYTCDRCHKAAKGDRSYWQTIYHFHIDNRERTDLCPTCFEFFKKFLKEFTPHEG